MHIRKRILGNSQIEVYPIGLGAMPMSIANRPAEDVSFEVIHASLDAGVNLIDTADVYCRDERDIGHNERLVAAALRTWKGNRAGITIATKGGLVRPEGRWERDGRPEHLMKACEASLRALDVEAITLYQLHAPDTRVPWEDSVAAMARLREQGKIRYVGLSNVDVPQIEAARKIVPITSVQNHCNAFWKKDFENGVVAYCAKERIAYLPYSPVGGGTKHGSVAKSALFAELAAKYDVSPYRVILAWLLQKGEHIIPIPGASKVASAVDSARAPLLTINPEDVRKIDNLPNGY